MTPERWKQVEAVFEEALELPAEKRTDFLQRSCDGDEELRREVGSLLDSHARAGGFIDQRSLFLATAEVDGDDAIVAGGELIGAYRVVRELGRGGMGAVYLAERADGQYQKRVAIKLIKRGMDTDAVLRHFRKERQILASFDHPNIARLFDGGTTTTGLPYFVMEYVEGVPIDEYCNAHGLSIAQRLKLFREACAAVAHAHTQGVIHRDIKCSNILVTSDGTPKLLDFGIAKLLQKEAETLVTMTGQRLMTPEYASPEQLRGERVTAASDVYSLGVVLYQLLAGTSPYRFKSDTPREMERAILEDEPVRPSTAVGLKRIQHSPSSVQKMLKGDLDNIVLMALRKEPERRYQSVEQFSEDIRRHLEGRPVVARPTLPPTRVWRWSRRNPLVAGACGLSLLLALVVAWLLLREQFNPRTTPAPEKSIAVLPFEYLSPDKTNAYLSDGIQEEILTRLSKIADLKVISRTSTQRYKSKPGNLVDIAKQLGVAHILEGSVQESGDALRVNVQLINAQSDSHLWAENYDRKLTDIFGVESDIATRIANTLQAKLTGSEQRAISSRPTENSEAHQLYLRGRFFWRKRTDADVRTALDYFQQAIARDPNYAPAYSGVADCYIAMPFTSKVPSIEWGEYFAQAKLAATKALEIDDGVAEAHTSLAAVLNYEFNFREAKREFLRAIDLDPNYVTAHQWYGSGVLRALGEFDDAIAELKRAVELDPLSTAIHSNLAYTYIYARRYPEAAAQARKALAIDPNHPNAFFAYDMLALALALGGDINHAIEYWNHSYSISKDYHSLTFLAYGYGLKGDREKALQLFDQLREMEQQGTAGWEYGYAYIELSLNDKNKALDWLEKSYQRNEREINAYIRVDPLLDPLHGDPRFEALVQKVFADEQAPASKVPPPQKSIAVMPFEYLSEDKANAYLADGIQEEILTRLSKIADLKVISRTSTQRYKSKPENLTDIGKQLGVAHILEGSLEKAGDQVRVHVQLINAQTDSHLWAERYDRKLTDIFAVESEIAAKIADTLQAKLTGQEQRAIAARPTENSKAYELYLRGRFHWNKGVGPEFDKSREYYEKAIQLDPTYALAYAGLADYYGYAFAMGLLPPEEKWAKAEEDNAKKALGLEPTLGEAYNPLAAAELYYHRDWSKAEQDFRRGLELSPNFAEMHLHYATCLVFFGRDQEALAEMQRALDLDPLSSHHGFYSAQIFFLIRRYDAAIDRYRKTLELDPNFPLVHEWLGYAYEKKGMQKEAIAELTRALTLRGEEAQASILDHAYASSGFEAAVRALAQKQLEQFNERIARGEYVAAAEFVKTYTRLGDKEQAFAWLAKAVEERNRLAFVLKVDPILDVLRGDPRFEQLANKIIPLASK